MGSSVILPPPGQPAKGPDPSFKQQPGPQVVTFNFDKVGPPSPLYVQRDDALFIEAFGILDVVTIRTRLLLSQFPQGGQPDVHGPVYGPGAPFPLTGGIIQRIDTPLVLTGAGVSGGTARIDLTEGFLLSVGVLANNALQRGQTFVRGSICRAPFQILAGAPFTTLFADYVTQQAPIGWPNGRTLYSTEGPGELVGVLPANPGAGVDFSIAVPAQRRYRPISLTAKLVTSATVANRFVHATVQDGGGDIFSNATQATAQTATQTVTYTFGPGLTSQIINDGVAVITLPSNLTLLAGWTIQSLTTGIQAGDQWSLISLAVERWLDQV